MANRSSLAPAGAPPATRASFVTGSTPLAVPLEQLLGALPVGVYVCAADGTIVNYNAQAAALWGRTPRLGDSDERFCGSLRLFLLDGRPLPHDETPMATALRDGKPFKDVEVVIERPDGSRIIALVNIAPLTDDEGRLSGAVNCFQDITERKEAQEALQQGLEDVEDFFENGSVALHLVDGNGTIVRANRAELDLLGYRRDEYVGHAITDFHADQSTIEDILVRLRRGERLDKYEAQLIAKDGSLRDVLISSSARFRGGAFDHTRCFTLDVTDRKRAERLERQLAAIVEFSDDAIISADLNGIIMTWNAGAQRLFGYTAEQAIGQPVTMLIPPGRPDEEPEILRQIRRGQRIEHYDTVRRRKDGMLVDISLTVSPIRGNDGRIIGASKIARDISERKRSEKRQRLLLAELDHRVKNTLATVQSIANQTLRDEGSTRVFTDRLGTLAQTHNLLAASHWEGAWLHALLAEEFAPYGG